MACGVPKGWNGADETYAEGSSLGSAIRGERGVVGAIHPALRAHRCGVVQRGVDASRGPEVAGAMICTKSFLVAARVLIGLLLLVGAAHADEQDGRQEHALRLFKEARLDMRDERYGDACPKFAESNTLDPGAGTMLNLAYCYEKLGKRARAWAEYQSAASAAQADGKSDWEEAAHVRAAQLEGTIAWIVVHADAPADVKHLDIRLDGEPFDVGQLERPTPVDPGRHDLKVSAPGKQTWSTTVEVDARQSPTVDVPALDPIPTAIAPPASQPARIPAAGVASPPGWGTQRVVSVAVAGVGVAALGVASGFGLLARSTYNGADCQGRLCTQQGADAQSRAYAQAAVATGAAVAGAIALVATGILWWTSPSPSRVRVEATAAQAGWGLSLEGAW